MGREPDDDRDSDTETIGMYGVGMKRAIFKMGREALVRTRYGKDTFEVPITSAWLDTKGWDPLPINEPTMAGEKLAEPGTIIKVKDLYEGVSRHFANDAFVNEVRTAISEHFTMFLQWGLEVELNGEPVRLGARRGARLQATGRARAVRPPEDDRRSARLHHRWLEHQP